MREKGFRSLVGLVMITAAAGCDNVAFGGVQVELIPPSLPAGSQTVQRQPLAAEAALVPLELGPVLYLVERLDGSEANIVPVAELADGGYRALPDSIEVPGLLERFPLGRWDPGAEFTLFAQGVRTGTFVSDGGLDPDASTCRTRPSASGRVEVRPEVMANRWFLALGEAAPAAEGSGGGAFLPPPADALVSGLGEDAGLRDAALNLAQRLIPDMGVLWPPAIPDTRRDLQEVVLRRGRATGLAVSYVYGDSLVVGPTRRSLAYSLFILAEAAEPQYEPVFGWHQRYDGDGKAFPRFLAVHDAHGIGAPDIVVEVFGESARWLAIVGPREGRWGVLYEDDCGIPAATAGFRTFP